MGHTIGVTEPEAFEIAQAFGSLTLNPDSQCVNAAVVAGNTIRNVLLPQSVHTLGIFKDYAIVKSLTSHINLCDTPVRDGIPTDDSWFKYAYGVLGVLDISDSKPFAYAGENNGEVFLHLVPRSGESRIARKSKDELRGHTDVMQFPFAQHFDITSNVASPMPDVVALGGIRNPDSVPTRLALLDDLLASLSPAAISELQKAQFIAEQQASFQHRYRAKGLPVLGKTELGEWCIRFSHSKLVSTTSEGTNALGEVYSVLPSLLQDVVVQSGDVLLFRNSRVIHGRAPVPSVPSPNSRWLIRAYGYRKATSGILSNQNVPHVFHP
jgi:L-asparagine oxygenase